MNYLAAIKDVLILAAVIYLVYFITQAQRNADTVKELQLIERQQVENAQTLERYRQEKDDALAEMQSQLGAITHSIDANRKPLLMCSQNGSRAVPSTTAAPASSAAGARGNDAPVGRDIRPDINQYEKDTEALVSSCRFILKSWPH